MRKNTFTVKYFLDNITVIIGVVLVWRGIWYALDALDMWVFGGSHFWTAVVGVVIGIVILYLPDKDLKELGKL